MPTIKKPVHVFVDEMAVTNGPPAEPLNLLYNTSPIGYGDWAERTYKMTLITPASSREFVRKVTIVEIKPEYVHWLMALDAGRDPFEGSVEMTGRFIIKGFIGDWYFTGTYDPKTRKGSLNEDEYDPELEHERKVQDAMSDYVLMQHGY